MRYLVMISLTCAALGIAVSPVNAQQAQKQFPLAAPAGKDSNARQVAPPGAVNEGPYDMSKWKYGSAFNAPPGTKIWNPAKIKLMQGGIAQITRGARAEWRPAQYAGETRSRSVRPQVTKLCIRISMKT